MHTQDGPRGIEPLPSSTTSLLRSAVVLPSLPSILGELVQNSIDAGATTIECGVSLDRWMIRCSDNGCGIPDSNFLKDRLGEESARYWSSKTAFLDDDHIGAFKETFGFRGEALVSMAHVGTLELVTKSGLDRPTEGIVIDSSRQLRRAYDAVQAARLRDRLGTTVTVRDIFHKWPVRRRPLVASTSSRANAINALRTQLALLALIHPLISFTLTDYDLASSGKSSASKVLNVTKGTEGIVGRWKQIWGRASIEKVHQFDDSLHDSEFGAWKVTGFFSENPSLSKSQQFIYVNSRPISSHDSALHKALNALFASSTFSHHTKSTLHLATSSATPTPSRASSPFDNSNDFKARSKPSSTSPKKQAEKHPVFLISLYLPPQEIDVTIEPEKRVVQFRDEEKVKQFVLMVARRFLQQNDFLSFNTKRVGLPSSASSSLPLPLSLPPGISSATPEPQSRHNDWLPTRRMHSHTGSGDIENETESRTGKASPSLIKRVLNGTVDRSALKRSKTANDEEGLPDWMLVGMKDWENPVFPTCSTTNDVNELNLLSTNEIEPVQSCMSFNTIHSYFRSLVEATTATSKPLQVNRRMLSRSRVIAQLDRKFLLAVVPESRASENEDNDRVNNDEREASDDNSSDEGASFLAIVDQHAASERVRVERFLRTYCAPALSLHSTSTSGSQGIETVSLCDSDGNEGESSPEKRGRVGRTGSPGVPVLVTSEEGKVIRENQDLFSRWGINLSLSSSSTPSSGQNSYHLKGGDYDQVWVKAVPRVVGGRLAREPALLQRLVRGFAAQIQDGGALGARASTSVSSNALKVGSTDAQEEGWVAEMRKAPEVILNLIDSKACRGAIMFNDPLTLEQAQRLLEELAQTQFPFQCAHGRPSLVPVVRLPTSCSSKRKDGDESPRLSSSHGATSAGGGSSGEERRIDWSRLA